MKEVAKIGCITIFAKETNGTYYYSLADEDKKEFFTLISTFNEAIRKACDYLNLITYTKS